MAQKGRLIKVICPNDTCSFLLETGRAYSVRMSQLTIEHGFPFCGACGEQMEREEFDADE